MCFCAVKGMQEPEAFLIDVISGAKENIGEWILGEFKQNNRSVKICLCCIGSSNTKSDGGPLATSLAYNRRTDTVFQGETLLSHKAPISAKIALQLQSNLLKGSSLSFSGF